MKIVRYKLGTEVAYGILENDRVERMVGTPYQGIKGTGEYHRLSEVRLLAPCEPTKIIAIGLNYASHAKQLNLEIPESPQIWYAPSTSVIGTDDKIITPRGATLMEYESEVAAVIGKPAKSVSKEKALEYVLGYTCTNDVTARDWQRIDFAFTRSKGSDTFFPTGPCIETELDPGNITVEGYLNGKQVQSGNTNDLIYDIPYLVSYISNSITLLPGDIISTGTPAGNGPMKSGDVIEIKCGGVGTLRNTLE